MGVSNYLFFRRKQDSLISNPKNAHDILRITCPKNESIWKYFHARGLVFPVSVKCSCQVKRTLYDQGVRRVAGAKTITKTKVNYLISMIGLMIISF
jgi:hypothetical protein